MLQHRFLNESSDGGSDSGASTDAQDVKHDNIDNDIRQKIEEATKAGYQKGLNEGLHNKRRELGRKAALKNLKEDEITDDFIVSALQGYEEYQLLKEKEAATENEKKIIQQREELQKELEQERRQTMQLRIQDIIRQRLGDYNVIPEAPIIELATSKIMYSDGRKMKYDPTLNIVEVDGYSSLDKYLSEFKNRYHNLFSDVKAPVIKKSTDYSKPINQSSNDDVELGKQMLNNLVYSKQRK